jgi:hypothetical protein
MWPKGTLPSPQEAVTYACTRSDDSSALSHFFSFIIHFNIILHLRLCFPSGLFFHILLDFTNLIKFLKIKIYETPHDSQFQLDF